MNYGILLSGSAYKKHVDKILKIQKKRAIRIISKSSYLYHTKHAKPLFEKYETLTGSIYDIHIRELCTLWFASYSVFDSLFTNEDLSARSL